MAESFDAHYERLLALLDEMVPLLRSEGDQLFAEWFQKDREGIAAGQTRAIQHLLGAYGGMGSINDYAIQDGAKRRRFERLRREIHEHADAMLTELDEGGYYKPKRHL